MAGSTPTPYYLEFLGSMEKGVNAGIASNQVRNNQLTEGLNITVRGNYVNPRPSVQKIAVSFPIPNLSSVMSGIFQGACVYEPDFGNASLMASISGRLVQFVIGGNSASAIEQTIPGDLNAQNLTQSWLWQSENYIICNDGTNLPIFFNGASSRRSFGPPVTIATASGQFTAPAVGSSVAVTLPGPYTGPLNTTVTVDGAFYQAVSTGAGVGNSVILTNVSDTPGNDIPVGSQVLSEPSVLSITTAPFTVLAGTYGFGGNSTLASNIAIQSTTAPFVGNYIYFGSATPSAASLQGGVIIGASPVSNIITLFVPNGFPPVTFASNLTIPAGTLIYSANTQPVVTVATTTQDVKAPAVGQSVTVDSTGPYSGPAGAAVFIGNAQYTITAGPNQGVGNILNLVNVNDTPGVTHGPGGSGGNGVITTVPELPAGRMGAYGLGRNWMSLTDGRSYIASDIVGGSSGTPTNQFRDAPLRVTENTFLFEGGVFIIPGSSIGTIRAFCFAATLDSSLGQGPLQVFTPTTVFSCNAPVDRTTWQSITNPIQTQSLISNGAQGQYSTNSANGDIIFRSIDGLRSLILARRDFDTWGNVPQSREVQPTLDADDTSLLSWESSVVFDNRYLFTANPTVSPNGVFHPVTIALNFDPVSTLNTKSPTVYDGIWTPFNVLQYVVGQFNGVERCFAFVANIPASKIEIWEMLPSASLVTADNGITPIVQDFATGDLFDEEVATGNKSRFDYCRLADGEISVDQVVGPVTFQTFYKPDQWAEWVPWFSWSVGGKSTFYTRMGLGEPPNTGCDPINNRPLREGFTFQIRIVMTGSCRLLSARFKAVPAPIPDFAKQACIPLP